jgi:hypothetical protein
MVPRAPQQDLLDVLFLQQLIFAYSDLILGDQLHNTDVRSTVARDYLYFLVGQ